MLRITKSVSEATAFTHAGTFHADEVFATVILAKRFRNLVVCRVNDVPDNISSRTIVYDIGGGALDHHQPEGAGKRFNDVPYAACGLVWKKFGRQILSYMGFTDVNRAWGYIDTMLIQGIDAVDNGVFPNAEYPSQALSISAVISTFNPTWDDKTDPDTAFMRAVQFATIVFDNLLKKIRSSINARGEWRECVKNSPGPILVLNRYLPWTDLFKENREETAKYMFVVYPSARNGWSFCTISAGTTRFAHRKDIPHEWWGLSGQELRDVSGVETAAFVHANGFMGSAATKEDAIKMASIAAAQ